MEDQKYNSRKENNNFQNFSSIKNGLSRTIDSVS